MKKPTLSIVLRYGFRNERAYYAVRDLLTYYDAEQTAFSIINQYVRFVDEEPDKRKNDWSSMTAGLGLSAITDRA